MKALFPPLSRSLGNLKTTITISDLNQHDMFLYRLSLKLWESKFRTLISLFLTFLNFFFNQKNAPDTNFKFTRSDGHADTFMPIFHKANKIPSITVPPTEPDVLVKLYYTLNG